MAEASPLPPLSEAYTARLHTLNAALQQAITQTFQAHRTTWDTRLGYEQARWRWATEEPRVGPDTSFVGYGSTPHAKPPEQALATSQAVQAAIQDTAAWREQRAAWLLDPQGTTAEQVQHTRAYALQHPTSALAASVAQDDAAAAAARLARIIARAEQRATPAAATPAFPPVESLVQRYTALLARLTERQGSPTQGVDVDQSARRSPGMEW